MSGINNFINGTNARYPGTNGKKLKLIVSAGLGGATGYSSSTAGNIVHLQVGVAENPVLVTYWPSAVSAHYSPIREYDVLWGAGVTVNVATYDHPNTWNDLSGNWAGQVGVYYFE